MARRILTPRNKPIAPITCWDEPDTHRVARDIMGENFVGIPELERAVQYSFHRQHCSRRRFRYIPEHIPFSEEVLQECAETHVLEADVGYYMRDMEDSFRMSLYPNETHPKMSWSRGLPILMSHKYAMRDDLEEKVSWRLIRHTAVVTGRTWEEQQAAVDTEIELIPSVRQMVYLMLMYFLSRGVRLFGACSVRTCTTSVLGQQIYCGHFNDNGIGTDTRKAGIGLQQGLSDKQRCSLGIATARKPDLL